MNQAMAQGLVFGRDIVFTFGPYASIYTQAFHPATDGLMVWGALYLALCFGLAAYLNFKDSNWYVRVLLLVTLAGLIYIKDALLFFYPLLVATYIFKSVADKPGIGVTALRRYVPLIIMFSAFGLLPLIKGSALVACAAIALLAFVWLCLKRNWLGAAVVSLGPLVSLVVFWMVAAQPLSGLPSYFTSMLPIVSGYTEAMSRTGKTREIFVYAIAATIILTIIFRLTSIPLVQRLIVLLTFSVILFMAFKGGFVRHDGHAVISGTMILLVALLVSSMHRGSGTHSVLFIGALVWFFIDLNNIGTSTRSLRDNIASTYKNAWHGAKIRLRDDGKLSTEFNQRLASIHAKSRFPALHGTTDIYSFDQSYLISSDNHWNPRPVLQSYSAYTPVLVEKNKQHLSGNKAPDNIIFKVQPIDGRMPSLEDGASWPIFYSRYEPTALENGFLFLKKRQSEVNGSESTLSIGTHSLGQVIDVPDTDFPIFVKINVKESVLGHVANIMLRPSELYITVHMENGPPRHYRFIPGMARTGFILSPLVENTNDFGLIYVGAKYLSDKKVKSFSIEAGGMPSLWQDRYEVEFSTFDAGSQAKFLDMYSVQQPRLQDSVSKIATAAECAGSVDVVNGLSPAPASFSAQSLLNVRGWLAISAEKGLLPQEIYVVLSEPGGRTYVAKTAQTARPDVGAHFQKSQLDASGYDTTVDVSKLKGRYSMGLAYADDGILKRCPQFNFTAEIGVR